MLNVTGGAFLGDYGTCLAYYLRYILVSSGEWQREAFSFWEEISDAFSNVVRPFRLAAVETQCVLQHNIITALQQHTVFFLASALCKS